MRGPPEQQLTNERAVVVTNYLSITEWQLGLIMSPQVATHSLGFTSLVQSWLSINQLSGHKSHSLHWDARRRVSYSTAHVMLLISGHQPGLRQGLLFTKNTVKYLQGRRSPKYLQAPDLPPSQNYKMSGISHPLKIRRVLDNMEGLNVGWTQDLL